METSGHWVSSVVSMSHAVVVRKSVLKALLESFLSCSAKSCESPNKILKSSKVPASNFFFMILINLTEHEIWIIFVITISIAFTSYAGVTCS